MVDTMEHSGPQMLCSLKKRADQEQRATVRKFPNMVLQRQWGDKEMSLTKSLLHRADGRVLDTDRKVNVSCTEQQNPKWGQSDLQYIFFSEL